VFCRAVVTHVISVGQRLHALHRAECVSRENFAGSAVPTGRKYPIKLWDDGNTGGFLQTLDAAKVFARTKIENFQGVITQCRDKQVLALQVDRKVVNAPFHARQRDSLHPLELIVEPIIR
jgi:hypothetical protein